MSETTKTARRPGGLAAAAKAVGDSWDHWFTEAGFHLPGQIPEAIGRAWADWLERNTDRIIEAIAEQMARNRGG